MRILCCLLILTLAGCGSKSDAPAKAGIPLSIKSPEAARKKSETAPKPTKFTNTYALIPNSPPKATLHCSRNKEQE